MVKKKTEKKANSESFARGIEDVKAGRNATGRNEDYDEGWIKGYQDLHSIGWERRYNEYKS
jgi:hypothetical protein